MKKVIFLLALVALLSTACSKEPLAETVSFSNLEYRIESNYVPTTLNRSLNEEDCFYSELLAGQTIDAGKVVVNQNFSTDEVIISFHTEGDWTINATHLSISTYDNPSFPTTGSGNPKIGKFEYSASHNELTNVVTYIFNMHDLGNKFSIASHAVVKDSKGNKETAWSEGEDFGGRSWAMYSLVDLTNCYIYEELE